VDFAHLETGQYKDSQPSQHVWRLANIKTVLQRETSRGKKECGEKKIDPQNVNRPNHYPRTTFPTFSSALLGLLRNHKQLWNHTRSGAELDKFHQAGPGTEDISQGHVEACSMGQVPAQNFPKGQEEQASP